MSAASKATRCRSGARHWFTYYGWVGSSAPTCRHCGATNPNYDRQRDPLADQDVDALTDKAVDR
jgi:hypothetical protein